MDLRLAQPKAAVGPRQLGRSITAPESTVVNRNGMSTVITVSRGSSTFKNIGAVRDKSSGRRDQDRAIMSRSLSTPSQATLAKAPMSRDIRTAQSRKKDLTCPGPHAFRMA